MNQEMYEDEVTKKEAKIELAAQETSMNIEEMIEYMIKAGEDSYKPLL
ncbi:MAG: hypothetical protein KBI12_05775 [Methanothrix sp.]|nr:hypothetical protein [Methanothrix sp.]